MQFREAVAQQGPSKDELLDAGFGPTPGGDCWNRRRLTPKIAEIAAGSFKRKEPPAIQGRGYVCRVLRRRCGRSSVARTFRVLFASPQTWQRRAYCLLVSISAGTVFRPSCNLVDYFPNSWLSRV
jgi:hypothetical protein